MGPTEDELNQLLADAIGIVWIDFQGRNVWAKSTAEKVRNLLEDRMPGLEDHIIGRLNYDNVFEMLKQGAQVSDPAQTADRLKRLNGRKGKAWIGKFLGALAGDDVDGTSDELGEDEE